MSRRATKKSAEPSKASLEEMPEVRLPAGKVNRGRYAERAARSLEVLALDKKLVAALGGPDAVAGILRALAAALAEKRPRRRRAA